MGHLVLAFVVGLIFILPFPGWQKLVRPFRLPGGHLIPFLGFFSSNMIVYWAGWNTN